MDIQIASILKAGGVKCPRCSRCHFIPDLPDKLCERCAVVLVTCYPEWKGNPLIKEKLGVLAEVRGLSYEDHLAILKREYSNYLEE